MLFLAPRLSNFFSHTWSLKGPTREAVDVVDIVDVVDERLRMGDITVAHHGGGKKETSFAFKGYIICV